MFHCCRAPLDFLQTCCKWPKNHRSLGNVSKGCGLLFLLFIDPHQAKPLLLTTRLMAAQLLSSTKGPWLAPLPFLIFLRPESYQHLSRDIISASRGQLKVSRWHGYIASVRPANIFMLFMRGEQEGPEVANSQQRGRRLSSLCAAIALDLPSVLGTLPEKPPGALRWLLPPVPAALPGPESCLVGAAGSQGNVLSALHSS